MSKEQTVEVEFIQYIRGIDFHNIVACQTVPRKGELVVINNRKIAMRGIVNHVQHNFSGPDIERIKITLDPRNEL